ncbi:MAG: hypothetical protein ABI390_03885, partial [Daejeonella sp.]
MKNPVTFSSLFLLAVILVLSRCANDKTVELHQNDSTMVGHNGGYGNQVKWGEHLVLSMGCGNCHTPKKMGPKG